MPVPGGFDWKNVPLAAHPIRSQRLSTTCRLAEYDGSLSGLYQARPFPRLSVKFPCGTRATMALGRSTRPSSKTAASEEVRRTLRYIEPLSDARPPLADFFNVRLDFLVFEKACEIGALEFERFGGLGLIALGPFHGSCDDVPAVFFHGFMVGQVKVGL